MSAGVVATPLYGRKILLRAPLFHQGSQLLHLNISVSSNQ